MGEIREYDVLKMSVATRSWREDFWASGPGGISVSEFLRHRLTVGSACRLTAVVDPSAPVHHARSISVISADT